VLTTPPDCVSWSANRIDCFARGTDGAMWHQWWDVAAAPPPPPAPAPVVFSQGTLEWAPTFSVNLDNGNLGLVGRDAAYIAPNLVDLQLVPFGGAQLSFAGGAQRGFAGCSAAAFSTSPVLRSTLVAGDYVCFRTDEGRIGEFRIDAIGPVLQVLSVSYTTWQ
jgi:hypothetical protein